MVDRAARAEAADERRHADEEDPLSDRTGRRVAGAGQEQDGKRFRV